MFPVLNQYKTCLKEDLKFFASYKYGFILEAILLKRNQQQTRKRKHSALKLQISLKNEANTGEKINGKLFY